MWSQDEVHRRFRCDLEALKERADQRTMRETSEGQAKFNKVSWPEGVMATNVPGLLPTADCVRELPMHEHSHPLT